MKIGITGITGKMGQIVAKEVLANELLDLSSALARPNSDLVGKDVGEFLNIGKTGIIITDSLEKLFDKSDVVIDFSSKQLTMECARIASEKHKTLISGTTGLTEEDLNKIKEYAKNTQILWSSNMSLGVNVLLNLVEETASILRNDYDVDILDIHHRLKKDAPSGTAVSLGKAIAKGKGWDFNSSFTNERNGLRPDGKIGYSVVRAGDSAGEHRVMFSGINETLELSHKSTSRIIFVKGAIRATFWINGKPNGFYTMQDVLKLNR